MDKMDKFLDIVYTNQISDSKDGDMYYEFFRPLLDKLKDLVSEKVYNELEEMFNNCATENNRFYAIAGMKLAIGVMDGTYIPTT